MIADIRSAMHQVDIMLPVNPMIEVGGGYFSLYQHQSISLFHGYFVPFCRSYS